VSIHDHPAVRTLATGEHPDSATLADFVRDLGALAASRVESLGSVAYLDSGRQRALGKSVDELVADVLEELADVVSYSAFIALRMIAASRAVSDSGFAEVIDITDQLRHDYMTSTTDTDS
jgi:hypothetical protein